jgi:hypothetical protein
VTRSGNGYFRTPEGYFEDQAGQVEELQRRLTIGAYVLPSQYDNIGRGTPAERDTLFGVPATDPARVALANIRPVWFNTSLGWEESYFAKTGTAGLTMQGIDTAFPAGWYPVSGAVPSADIRNHAALFSIPNAAMTLITSYTVGTLGHARAVTASGGALTIQVAGRYKIKGSFVLADATAVGGRLSQITKNSATDVPASYLAYGPYHPGQALSYNPNCSDEVLADLQVGDIIRLFGFQNSGAAKNLSRTTDAAGLADVGRVGSYLRVQYVEPPFK